VVIEEDKVNNRPFGIHILCPPNKHHCFAATSASDMNMWVNALLNISTANAIPKAIIRLPPVIPHPNRSISSPSINSSYISNNLPPPIPKARPSPSSPLYASSNNTNGGGTNSSIWTECKSEDGRTYYWNTVSNETSWTAPELSSLNTKPINVPPTLITRPSQPPILPIIPPRNNRYSPSLNEIATTPAPTPPTITPTTIQDDSNFVAVTKQNHSPKSTLRSNPLRPIQPTIPSRLVKGEATNVESRPVVPLPRPSVSNSTISGNTTPTTPRRNTPPPTPPIRPFREYIEEENNQDIRPITPSIITPILHNNNLSTPRKNILPISHLEEDIDSISEESSRPILLPRPSVNNTNSIIRNGTVPTRNVPPLPIRRMVEETSDTRRPSISESAISIPIRPTIAPTRIQDTAIPQLPSRPPQLNNTNRTEDKSVVKDTPGQFKSNKKLLVEGSRILYT
jgi:hypothetical protein